MWTTKHDVCFCFQFDSLNTLSLTNIDKGMWQNIYMQEISVLSNQNVSVYKRQILNEELLNVIRMYLTKPDRKLQQTSHTQNNIWRTVFVLVKNKVFCIHRCFAVMYNL